MSSWAPVLAEVFSHILGGDFAIAPTPEAVLDASLKIVGAGDDDDGGDQHTATDKRRALRRFFCRHHPNLAGLVGGGGGDEDDDDAASVILALFVSTVHKGNAETYRVSGFARSKKKHSYSVILPLSSCLNLFLMNFMRSHRRL